MLLRKDAAAIVAACCLFLVAQPATGDPAIRGQITDASYCHTFFGTSIGNANDLAYIVWFKDPDPARGFVGEWGQPIGDCSSSDIVTVSGIFPPYSPGRLSGTITAIDPKVNDVCHQSPKTWSYQLKGTGVETWIYRTGGLV